MDPKISWWVPVEPAQTTAKFPRDSIHDPCEVMVGSTNENSLRRLGLRQVLFLDR